MKPLNERFHPGVCLCLAPAPGAAFAAPCGATELGRGASGRDCAVTYIIRALLHIKHEIIRNCAKCPYYLVLYMQSVLVI